MSELNSIKETRAYLIRPLLEELRDTEDDARAEELKQTIITAFLSWRSEK